MRLSYVNDSGKTALSETIRPMKESAMIRSILANLRQRHALRQSVNGLLRRADDHLLEDIGLTRAEMESLLAARLPRQAKSEVYAVLYA